MSSISNGHGSTFPASSQPGFTPINKSHALKPSNQPVGSSVPSRGTSTPAADTFQIHSDTTTTSARSQTPKSKSITEQAIPSRPIAGLHRRLSQSAASQTDPRPLIVATMTKNTDQTPSRDPRIRAKSGKRSSPASVVTAPTSAKDDTANHDTQEVQPSTELILQNLQTGLARLVESAVVAGNAQYDVVSLESQHKHVTVDLEDAEKRFGDQPGLTRHLQEKRDKLQSRIRVSRELHDNHATKRDQHVSQFVQNLLKSIQSSTASSSHHTLSPPPVPIVMPPTIASIPPEILDQIKKLQSEVDGLEKNLSSLRTASTTCTAETGLRSLIEDMRQTMSTMPAQVIEKFENERLEHYVKQFETFTDTYEERIKLLEAPKEDGVLEELRGSLRNTDAKIQQVSDELEKYRKWCDPLMNTYHKSIHTLQEVTKKSVADILSVEQTITTVQASTLPSRAPESLSGAVQIQQEIAGLKRTLAANAHLSQKNEHSIASLNTRYNNITTEDMSKRIGTELNTWRLRIEQGQAKLQADLSEVRATRDQVLETSLSTNSGVSELTNRIKELETKVESVTTSTQSRSLAAHDAAVVEKYATELTAVQGELVPLKGLITDLKRDVEAKVQAHQVLLDELSHTQAGLERDLTGTSRSSKAATSAIVNLRIEADTRLEAMEELLESLKKAHARVDAKVEDARATAQKAVEECTKDKLEMEDKVKAMQIAVDECREDFDEFRDQVEDYCEQLAQSFKEVNSQHRDNRSEIVHLKKEAQAVQTFVKIPAEKLPPPRKVPSQSSSPGTTKENATPNASRDESEDVIEVVVTPSDEKGDSYLADWNPKYAPKPNAKPTSLPLKPATLTSSSRKPTSHGGNSSTNKKRKKSPQGGTGAESDTDNIQTPALKRKLKS